VSLEVDEGLYPDVEEALLWWLVGDSQIAEMIALAGVVYQPGVIGAAYPYEFGSPSSHVDTVTPADLQLRLPFVRLGALAGSDDRVTDTSLVDIEVFAAKRNHAYRISAIIRQRLTKRFLRIDTPSGLVIVDWASTEVKPYALPWDDPDVDRWLGQYSIAARR
jgi:hypothetical protein